MIYIIALIVILAAVIFYGTWFRRKIYKQIDKLESWKIDIMNRPVTEEISRVKRLKMFGETEEKFETWRTEWDDIITVELPSVEEKLFEAEEAADKFRFGKARAKLEDIREHLNQAEKRIEELLQDLDHLISSEEQNRVDIVSVKEKYHEAKKTLLTHRRYFQKAIFPIEEKLKNIEHQLETFETLTEEGNYMEARSVLLEVRDGLDGLHTLMEEIPELFDELQNELPEQIKELRDGHREMVEQGFVLDHIMLEDQLGGVESRIQEMIRQVEQAETESPAEEINEVKSRIDIIYDQLEQEAASRQFVIKESSFVKDKIEETDEAIDKLKGETELVQLSYRIEKEDLAIQEELEKEMNQLKNKFAETEKAVREQRQAFSSLQDRLKGMKERLRALDSRRVHHQETLAALRKDELRAKESLHGLRRQLIDAKRIVQKSNLPGIPETHLTSLESAEDKIIEVEDKLRKKPLEMMVVNRLLTEALAEVEDSFIQTKKMIEDAELAERLIQYGNRYRSRYQSIQAGLAQAEFSFRNYRYEEALEQAAAAIQKVEPDILKKFDTSVVAEEV